MLVILLVSISKFAFISVIYFILLYILRKAGKPLSVVVINHKRGRLSAALIRKFPHIKIYEEPAGKDIFGKLGGAWRQVILYDVCCRKQYLYGYPFSWMGYSFVR